MTSKCDKYIIKKEINRFLFLPIDNLEKYGIFLVV